MSIKEEYTAIDMATAAADGFRDGQRAANDHSAQSLGMVGALVTALDGLLSITQDSTGVAGYHLNGNVAEWDEFPEVDTARDVLSLYRERADKPCFFGIDLAQGALDAGPWRDAIIDQGWTPPEQQQASDKIPFAGFDPNFCPGSNPENPQTEEDEPEQASAAQSAHHNLLGELYQVLGALDAPDNVLDNVSAAIHDEPLPHATLLPFVVAAQSAPAGEREAEAAAIAEEIDWLIRQWDAGVSWSGERMAELLEAAGKASEMLAAWQRTQSAGVPDDAMVAVASAAYEREALAGATHEQAWHVALSEAIAAAPAQPAALKFTECSCGGGDFHGHTAECQYEHFLSYSSLKDDPSLRYAYIQGIGGQCEQPAAQGEFNRAHIMDALLMWNRRHEEPPIRVGYEYGVAEAVLDLAAAQDHTEQSLGMVAHDQGEVQRLREAGDKLYNELRQWLATEHDPESQAALREWRAALAASTGQEVES